jgi:hypothetical protein
MASCPVVDNGLARPPPIHPLLGDSHHGVKPEMVSGPAGPAAQQAPPDHIMPDVDQSTRDRQARPPNYRWTPRRLPDSIRTGAHHAHH